MKKILVADDELDIRNLTKIILEENGYQVSLAANGAEARLCEVGICFFPRLSGYAQGMRLFADCCGIMASHPDLPQSR
jgi:hypothetical protein